MSHPFLRIVGLVVVLCATPVVRFVSCFSIGLALVLSGVVEAIDALAAIPEPPQIPTRDLRWATSRCTP